MYARSTTINVNPSRSTQVAQVRDDVMPALMATEGCIGLSMLVDRVSGHCITTTAWRSEEAMRATDDDVGRPSTARSDVGAPEVQEWEIAVLHRDHRSVPARGSGPHG